MSNTLVFLDQWIAQEERVGAIYKETLVACGYINAPTIELSQFDKVPIARGLAACYINTHQIFVDFAWASQATDAELAGCLAHELAHGVSGIKAKHNKQFRAIEREILDRMECRGMEVTPAPDQNHPQPAEAKTQSRFGNWAELFLMVAPVTLVLAVGGWLWPSTLFLLQK